MGIIGVDPLTPLFFLCNRFDSSPHLQYTDQTCHVQTKQLLDCQAKIYILYMLTMVG